MKITYFFLVFILILYLSLPSLQAQSNDDCYMCHADPTFSAKIHGHTVSLYIDSTKFSQSVHKNLQCIDCHSGIKELPHQENLPPVNCGNCHSQIEKEFNESIHGQALKRGAPYAPTCHECHGTHHILAPSNDKSTVFKMNVPALCGKCHREGAPVARVYNIPEKNILSNYSESIHGEGLFKMGLLVTATCNNCHGNHLILPVTDPHSTISPRNIAQTCMRCHSRIEQVHQKIIRGALWEQRPGVVPACTDCHLPHKIRAAAPQSVVSDQSCMKCHAKADIFKVVNGNKVSLTVNKANLQNSVHKNIPCVACHSDISPKHPRPCDTAGRVDCGNCHAEVAEKYFASDHGKAYQSKNPQAPYCTNCHGTHLVYSHQNDQAQTYRTNIPKLCGDCHAKLAQKSDSLSQKQGSVLMDYSRSVHGVGLVQMGLLPSAVCTDCHSTHYILGRKDPQSTIFYKNIPATCGTCHKGIYEKYISSIHSFTQNHTDKALPVCDNCHSAHRIQFVQLDPFMREVTQICGSCHERLAKSYFQTIHGKAYMLGYLNAAKCSDCHGAHHILSVNNPESRVGILHIVQTCKKCHSDANRRFTGYLTHATHHDRAKYPVMFFAYWAMHLLLISVFLFFGIHALLWLPRSLKHHREKEKASKSATPQRYYIRRFTTAQRIIHLFVIISFMTLAITGMMLRFAGTGWADFIAVFVGGVKTAGILHRIAAVITFGYFFTHIGMLIRLKFRNKISWRELIFGENSMWFKIRDIRQFWKSLKWFVGLGPRPEFGRWTYWEKFDYFAVFWGVAVIGLSGLMLWFPEFFTLIFPGWLINVAVIIHGDEALLAVGFIFTIHFFNSHLRPESFPLDPVIFTGLVPVDDYKQDRPAEYKALKESGELKKRVVLSEISPRKMLYIRIFGYIFLTLGILLIISIILSMLLGYR
jgi:cytochrome b subunit of formate dehydrogenase/nitrate/TMAO reductase-like tetraheme cytochrome c subunit